MKKYIKWSVFILFSPILLIMILAVMLYLPPVQNWAVRQVAAYASESTGMDVTVDHVKLVFPLRLGVEGVQVLQPIDSLKSLCLNSYSLNHLLGLINRHASDIYCVAKQYAVG